MARILVTGGVGFLGSHLCDRLIETEHEVICVDNLVTGSKDNVAHLLDHPKFDFILHDVIEPLRLEIDTIYHLACPASPPQYQRNPVRTVKANVIGTMNMLGLARRTKARILLASTSEVYGDPAVHPQSEDYFGNVNTLGPRACYDEGKRIAETLMMEYHRQHGVDVRIARIFNTYGPRMARDDGRVVSNFICNALAGKPLELYGDGQQSRSFCYVDDMLDGLIALMNYEGELRFAPFNLGNPVEHSIKELAELACKLADSESEVVLKPSLEDDPTKRCPNITRASDEIGFDPKIELEEGLMKTIEFFQG
ncbi:MAG: UDP-glucuronic acid decarboxylase family protein [Planctomycetota bacterium]|jgi:UDP-glucuronate decarboxylase